MYGLGLRVGWGAGKRMPPCKQQSYHMKSPNVLENKIFGLYSLVTITHHVNMPI